MTRNQIEYLKHKETQRANLRQEELTAARDSAAKELGFQNLAETSRHNQVTEQHAVNVLGEQQRHNYAQEAYNVAVLGEQTRHNMVSETLTQQAQDEQRRANLAREAETSRHNLATEGISREQLDISRDQLDIQRGQLEVSLGQLAETQRANQAREAETQRSNIARETETHRSNVASEQYRQQQIQLGYDQLSETSKYHSQSVSLGYSQLSETSRSNRARENISMGELAERQRANAANEALTKARDKMNYEESVRSNVAREIENTRHNQAQEQIALEQNEIRQYEAEIKQQQANETKRHNVVSEVEGGFNTAANVVESARKLVPLFTGGLR